MSIYSRIFANTSKRFASATISGRKIPPHGVWGIPGAVVCTWFIWGALTDDIKQSVGLYWDPDAEVDRVEAERFERLEAKEALKAAKNPSAEDEEDEEEDEGVTAEDIEEAVNAAIEQSGDAEEEEDEEFAPEPEGEEEEEEEEEKPKKKKVDPSTLTQEERWEYFNEKAINPGEDDVSTNLLFAVAVCCLSFLNNLTFSTVG